MKIKLTLKDPDGVSECVRENVEDYISRHYSGMDHDEAETIAEVRTEIVEDSIQKWVEFNEYVTIEIDTEAGTATVLEV